MSPTDRVMQSYGRCCASPDFFDSFYRHFLASSPEVREKFVNTEMNGQKLLLRQGILNLVMHARGMPDTKLRAPGCSHSPGCKSSRLNGQIRTRTRRSVGSPTAAVIRRT